MNFFEKFGLLITVLVHLRVRCAATTVPTTCEMHQFRCDDGECIAMINLCNGRKDCSDDSDEAKCNSENYPKCTGGFFQCVSDRRCIPTEWRCDDEDDCADDSDEEDCNTSSCNEYHEFECSKNRQCIYKGMRCNGNIDCDDGSDEQNCEDFSDACLEGNIPCEDDHHCIPREWLCDGERDCTDGSDEKQCDNNPTTSTTPTTIVPGTTEPSCPDDYCVHNADCVVVRGQYHCNCSPSFTGKMCEMRITAERAFHDLGMVIGIAMTLIILFIIIALMFFYYYKRRTTRNSTALISKSESQMPFTSYSKE
ncbi:Low-density lipoprotein receptor-related protein 1B [Araneus ventricosus]|uniref:Low-density lipoprotein receptor-related protein 1B n=1 Tax=Araneus ventricosus TaxID=182803 RepID=A0A4Y2S6D6_ARAVE|nr:Low-density lipoprotein receptor-related protein 1B [Araneus ventricosus]